MNANPAAPALEARAENAAMRALLAPAGASTRGEDHRRDAQIRRQLPATASRLNVSSLQSRSWTISPITRRTTGSVIRTMRTGLEGAAVALVRVLALVHVEAELFGLGPVALRRDEVEIARCRHRRQGGQREPAESIGARRADVGRPERSSSSLLRGNHRHRDVPLKKSFSPGAGHHPRNSGDSTT